MKKSLCLIIAAIVVLTSCKVDFPTVSADRFEELLSEPGVQLIDARHADEYETGYIAGSTNIDVTKDNFKKEALKVLDKSRKVCVHCQKGGRGAKAAAILKRAGFDVYNLEGGFDAWAEAGKPYVVPETGTLPVD